MNTLYKSHGVPLAVLNKVLDNYIKQYVKRIIHTDQANLLQEFQECKDGLNIFKNVLIEFTSLKQIPM